ncbi:MAG: oligosaccharide flippase family protein [Solirubrobacterales bacterium]|nr:oligosaccharide flippase family protein [Solirubrobacterales bacterium]
MSELGPIADPTDVLDGTSAGGRAISGGLLRVLAYAIGSLLAVGSTAVVARYLGTEAFGDYATVLSLSAIALLTTDFGLATLGVREYVARTGEDRDHVMRVLIGLRMGLMGVGALGMLLFATLAGFSGALWLGTLLAGLGLVVQAVPATYAVPLHATLRLGWVGGLDLVRQATQALVLVLLVVAGAGVAPLLGSLIPAGLVTLVVGASVARGLAPLRPAFDWAQARQLLRMALSFALATSVGAIYAYLAQVVVDLTVGSQESGLFALSFRVFAVIIAVAIIAVGSAYPILTRTAGTDETRFGYAASKLYEGMFLLGAGIAVAVGVGAPVIVALLGGPEFEDAVGILRLHGIAVAGSFLVAVGSFVLLAQHRFRALLWINLTTLGVSVVLTWAMASAFGGEGAAAAMCITEIGLATAFFVTLRRGGGEVGLAPRAAGAVLFSAAVAVAVAVGLTEVLGAGTGVAVVITAAALSIFAACALATGGVPGELTGPLRARLARR